MGSRRALAEILDGHACLLDGQTLQDAADLTSPQPAHEHVDPLIQLTRFLSLFQVLEAIIAYDRILTSPTHAYTWQHLAGAAQLQSLEILDAASLPIEVMEFATARGTHRVLTLAGAPHFQAFIDDVARSCIEGVFLRSAQHYSRVDELGFSDVLADADLARLRTQAQREWHGEDHSGLVGAVVVLASGCFTYRALSTYASIPYFPHCLRAPLALFDDIRPATSSTAATTLALRILRQTSEEALRNALGVEDVSFTSMPVSPLASLALSRAQTRADLLPMTLALRESPEGRRFRAQMSRLSVALRSARMREISTCIAEIKRDAANSVQSPTLFERLAITVSVPGLEAKLETPVAPPAWLTSMRAKLGRTTLYQLVTAELPTVKRLLSDIDRLFGSQAARAIDQFLPR